MHGAAEDFVQIGGHGIDFGAQLGGGFVHEVDGLVGQEAVGDVAVGEDGGGDEGGVLDAHAVVDFIALAQAAEDGDGIFDGGLVDEDELEAALEGGVLLDVLAVLVEGGGADAVKFAAGEHGLEEVAGVHGAFGLPRPDDGVELVDEEDDLAFGRLNLFENGLEALLELAAELGAGDQRAHVERDDALLLQALGDIAADDALGEAFDDGGLADTGLADQDGVVLGAAGEDLNDAADFGIAADDGVELVLGGGAGEVAAVLFEGFVGGLGIGGGDALGAADFDEGLHEAVAGEAGFLEDAAGGAVVLDGGEEDVLDGDVVVLEALGLVLGGGEELLRSAGDVDLVGGAGGAGDFGQAVEFLVEARGDEVRGDAGLGEDGGGESIFLIEQGRRGGARHPPVDGRGGRPWIGRLAGHRGACR